MSHEEPSPYRGADMLHIDSYHVFQIAQRIMSHLSLHNGVYHACFCDVVILRVDLSVLKRVVYWAH